MKRKAQCGERARRGKIVALRIRISLRELARIDAMCRRLARPFIVPREQLIREAIRLGLPLVGDR
jgi:hypothetical protein